MRLELIYELNKGEVFGFYKISDSIIKVLFERVCKNKAKVKIIIEEGV